MIRSGWPLSMIACSSAVKPQPHITTTMMSSSASLLACIAPGRSDRGRIPTTLVEIAARISPPPPAPTCGRPRSKPARRRQGGSLAQAGSRSVCDGVVNDRFAVEPKAERNHHLADVIGRPSRRPVSTSERVSGCRLAIKRFALGPAGRPLGDGGAEHPPGGAGLDEALPTGG